MTNTSAAVPLPRRPRSLVFGSDRAPLPSSPSRESQEAARVPTAAQLVTACSAASPGTHGEIMRLRRIAACVAPAAASLSGLAVSLERWQIDVASPAAIERATAFDQSARVGRPCWGDKGVAATTLPTQRRILVADVHLHWSDADLSALLVHELTHTAQVDQQPALFIRTAALQRRIFERRATPEECREILALNALQEGHAIYTHTRYLQTQSASALSVAKMPSGDAMLARAQSARVLLPEPLAVSALGYALVKNAAGEGQDTARLAGFYQRTAELFVPRFVALAERWQAELE